MRLRQLKQKLNRPRTKLQLPKQKFPKPKLVLEKTLQLSLNLCPITLVMSLMLPLKWKNLELKIQISSKKPQKTLKMLLLPNRMLKWLKKLVSRILVLFLEFFLTQKLPMRLLLCLALFRIVVMRMKILI